MLYNKRWEHEIEIPAQVTKTKARWQLLLLDSADLIEKKGWIRNNYKQNDHYCIVGAIVECDKYDNRQASEAASHLTDHLGVSVIYWNDNIAKSKEQVVSVMREVAERGEPQHEMKGPISF